jgi:hypothetical protein
MRKDSNRMQFINLYYTDDDYLFDENVSTKRLTANVYLTPVRCSNDF